MKKIILVAITVLFISTPAFAEQSTWDYVYPGNNSGNQDNNQPSDNNNSDSGYQGSSGTNYQYDLNDPGDRIDYSTDTDAQRRDSLSTDPGRIIDNGLGQNGGGIND